MHTSDSMDLKSLSSASGIGEGSRERLVDSYRKRTPQSCFVIVFTVFAAIGGFLFGYDTGVISGAMILLREHFPGMTNFWQELIVAVTIGAAAVFALIGGLLNDWLGRRPVVFIASGILTIGAVTAGAAPSKVALIVGRLIVGIGIGLASMTVPMYIAECAPTHMRGRLVTINNMFITGGQFVASLVDGAFSYDKENGWRYMLGLAGVPSLLQFVGFLFLPESPRWLIARGRKDEARRVLSMMRGGTSVDDEVDEIQHTIDKQHGERHGRAGRKPVIVQMLQNPPVRRALIVGCGMQMFQQLAGINTVMYYSATIIKMSGVKDDRLAIWLAAVVAFVNLLFTAVGVYLVEKLGRRKLSLGSMIGVFFSLIFLGVGFLLSAIYSPPLPASTTPLPYNHANCTGYSSCYDCISSQHCGFCFVDDHNSVVSGTASCQVANLTTMSAASWTSCATNKTLTYAYDFCPTSYSWMAFAGLVLYLAFFAPGMGPMPWTINSEIYPIWARSTGNACATAVNWIFNLVISMTFLTLTDALTRYGTFFLYSGIAFLGLCFIYFLVPETKDKKLEEVTDLFAKPFCSWRPVETEREVKYIQIKGHNAADTDVSDVFISGVPSDGRCALENPCTCRQAHFQSLFISDDKTISHSLTHVHFSEMHSSQSTLRSNLYL
ncbi:proton myo-inositol cotransporter-like isoform X3 [Ptychodera flava]|uniref:proton myo-inositol cotransporter-like isoform X3 n=1 Tax=Ptychodera flava TaxID=63121 RepID=UPI00396A2C91